MPHDPKKLVFAKEKFATGWQATGRFGSLAQFASFAEIDPKSITRLQKREKPVSLRVMTKYAKALGYEVSDVVSSDTIEAAKRSHIKIDKTGEWLYAQYKDFGSYSQMFEPATQYVSLRPYVAREIIDASTNLKYEGHWEHAVYPQPIWILDNEVRSGSDSLAKNIETLSKDIDSFDQLEVGNKLRNSLSLIAKNLTRAASVEATLANLKRQNEVHVLGGNVSTFIFNHEQEVFRKRWVQVTYPIFLITSLGNVTGSVAVKALIEKNDVQIKGHVGGPEAKTNDRDDSRTDWQSPSNEGISLVEPKDDEVPF